MSSVVVGGVQFDVGQYPPSLFTADDSLIARHWNPKKGQVCIDAGFGPGTWSLVALARQALTFSFDPKPLALQMLLNLIIINGFTTGVVAPFGLWNETKTLPMRNSSFKWEGELDGNCKVVALDEYLEPFSLSRIDFINMDVEAAEKEVIEGAKQTLKRYRPKLIIEVHAGIVWEDLEKGLSDVANYKFTKENNFLIASIEV